MPRPAQSQAAYVLHRRAYRETSAIVELLTRDFGRVAGVVRGVKGGRRSRYDVEPFAQVSVSWRGGGQLVTVLRCENAATPTPTLRGERLYAGLYLNELLVKTLGIEDPVAPLFDHYGETLARLAGDDDPEPALRAFERRLLDSLGYGLVFDADVRTGRTIDAAGVYGVVDGEGFRAQAAADDHADLVLTGAQIEAIDAGDFSDAAVRRAAKRIFRRALARRLGDGELATRRLFQARQAAAAGA